MSSPWRMAEGSGAGGTARRPFPGTAVRCAVVLAMTLWLGARGPAADAVSGQLTGLSRRYPSPALGREVPCCVWLPPGYREAGTNRYPVLYWLPDRGEDPQRPALAPAVLAEAIRRRIVPPFVLVAVGEGADMAYQDSAQAGGFAETTLLRELMPYVDRTWRTVSDRGGRVVLGAGAGGRGAVRLAVAHPESFAAAVSFGGEFPTLAELATNAGQRRLVLAPFGGDTNLFLAQQPGAWLRTNAARIRDQLGLMLVVGKSDPREPGRDSFQGDCFRERIPLRVEEVEGGWRDRAGGAEGIGVMALEFAAGWLGAARSADRDGPWVNPPTNRLVRIEHHVFYSERLGRPVGYSLYRPPRRGVEVTDSLPVLYHLHGWGENESSQIETMAYLDAAVRLGEVPPMAWVWPYGGRFSWFTDSLDGRVPAASVLWEELLPHVEERWQLGGRRERRGLDGWGMGAFGALRTAAAVPPRFAAVLVQDPEFPDAAGMQLRHPDAWLAVFDGDLAGFMAREPLTLLTQGAATLKPVLDVRLVIRPASPRMPEIQRVKDRLARLGIRHEVEEVAEATGTGPQLYRRTGLRDLQWIARRLSAPIPSPAAGP